MAKQKTNPGAIVIGIIVIVALFYFLPKSTTFSLLPAGECNYNTAQNFLTNINYGEAETIDSYYLAADTNVGGWVAVDWNGDGKLEIFGKPQITTGDVSCAGKTPITTTPAGLRVVQFDEDSAKNTVGICPEEAGKVILFYSNQQPSDAKTEIEQCTNHQAIINNSNGLMCSQLAMRCSDGSYVAQNVSNNCTFNQCPLVNLNCTSDKYVTCTTGITYKYQQCTNGTLSTLNYLVNPCNANINSTVNCTFTYSAWSTCSNSTGTAIQTHTVTNSSSITCANQPLLEDKCSMDSGCLFKIDTFCVKIWMLLILGGFIILVFLLRSK